jgi:hypothetical protein
MAKKGKLYIKRPKQVMERFKEVVHDAASGADYESLLVSAKRARHKIKKLREPTPRQARALRFIWMRDLTFADCIGINWIDLGGLFCRGYLTWKGDKLEVIKDVEKFFLGN